MPVYELLIDGASCGSCVKKIETAIQQVEGVEKAEMNFAQRTVSVSTTSNSDALILAVEKAGYNATLSQAENEEQALSEKEAADWVYYKKLMRDMILALSLGVPLMLIRFNHWRNEC